MWSAPARNVESASKPPPLPRPVRRHEENSDVRYPVSSFMLPVCADRWSAHRNRSRSKQRRIGAGAREWRDHGLAPSTPTSMSGGHMGTPIGRANPSDEIVLVADMARPCGTIGRDSLACRLMRRSLVPTVDLILQTSETSDAASQHLRHFRIGTFETCPLRRAMSEFEVQNGKHMLVLSSSQFDPCRRSLVHCELNKCVVEFHSRCAQFSHFSAALKKNH